jgi:nucleotide-binding universal stress UspA family protein
MIVVSSHGRSGLERIALGSFAENLLCDSERPVLFLTHAPAKVAGAIQRVLFPTDLSEKSRIAFQQFLPQAKALQAELVLFYAVALPNVALSPGGLYGAADVGIPEDYFPNMESWAKKEGSRWAEEARAYGVTGHVVITDEGVSSQVAKAILRVAHKEQVQLIAMASLSGAFSSFVAGSVAREVFRTQEYPVWIWGPKAEASTEHESSSSKHARAL